MEKKRSLILIFELVSGLLVGLGVFFLIFLNLKGNIPQEIKIDESYYKISFVAQDEDLGLGYTFRIRNEQTSIFLKSDINVLEANQELLDKGIKLGEIYKISYALNKDDGKEPLYSNEVSWTASQFLESTDLFLDSGNLYWNSVENADYYTISYFVLDQNYIYDTEQTYCPLSKLKGGEYSISVEAKSNKTYYKTSKTSNMLPNLTVIHEIPAFDEIKLERFSKRLKITSKELVSKIVILVEDSSTTYNFTNLTTSQNADSTYTIYCDISSIYDGVETIGVLPGEDAYNHYNGETSWIKLTA